MIFLFKHIILDVPLHIRNAYLSVEIAAENSLLLHVRTKH